MKFTMGIPLGVITPGEFQTMEAVTEMAQAMETARVDACFVTDHPAPSAEWLQGHGHDTLDPFTALGFVAAVSKTLMLHTNILVLAYRNPFITAKAAATLQVLSSGRLILGVGAGYQKPEFEALGVDFHKRGAIMDEALDVMRLAWSGEVVVKEGRGFNAVGALARPAPNPQPLIWIGGGSDKAVERAARAADGWSPFFAAPTMSKLNQDTGIHTVEQLSEKIGHIHEQRVTLGKTGPFDVAIGPRAKIKGNTRAEADAMIEELALLEKAGVNWAMVEPAHPSRAAFIENVQWFGEEVIARA